MSKKKVKKYTKYELEVMNNLRKKKTRTIAIIVGIVLVIWLGFAIWDASTHQPADTSRTGVDVSSVEDYLSSLN